MTISGPTGLGAVTANLTIRNSGHGLLTGSWSSLDGGTTPYSVTGSPFTLQPQATTTIAVSFTPTVKGRAATATFTISVDTPSTGGRAVVLRGIGR
jgi:hypothetical protein